LWTPIIQASCQSTTKSCDFGNQNRFLNPRFEFRGDVDLQLELISIFLEENSPQNPIPTHHLANLTPKPDQYLIFKIGDVEFPMMICEHKIHDKGNELEKVTVKSFLLVSAFLFILI